MAKRGLKKNVRKLGVVIGIGAALLLARRGQDLFGYDLGAKLRRSVGAALEGNFAAIEPSGGAILTTLVVLALSLALGGFLYRRATLFLSLHAPTWLWIPHQKRIFQQDPTRDETGWIYVLANASMPGILKVGYTQTHPRTRAKQLSNTSVATPFTVKWSLRSGHAHRIEHQAHRLLGRFRVNEDREFFRCRLEDAISAITAAEAQVKASR